jgi:hypothetical protein
VSATAQGVLSISAALPVVGQIATTAQGTLGVTIETTDKTIALTGAQVGVSMGLFNLQRTNDLTGKVATASQGNIIRALNCSLDYVESGYIDDGYTCIGSIFLDAATITAIANAVWARTLPLSGSPATTYGPLTLSQSEINNITYAVWSKQL